MSVVKVYIVHGTSSQDFCTYSSIHQLIHDLLITVITFLKIDFAVCTRAQKNIDSLNIPGVRYNGGITPGRRKIGGEDKMWGHDTGKYGSILILGGMMCDLSSIHYCLRL